MKLCTRCNKYHVVLEADKSEPSKKCKVAPQSISEEEHRAAIPRWSISHPVVETDYCYYCGKVVNKRISKFTDYGIMYEAKQLPIFEIRASI